MGIKKNQGTPFSNATVDRSLHKNLDFTAREQYKLLRANLDFILPENTKCPVIGVTSSMRGEGKSTTSINLSYVLAEMGHKVLLLDGDLRIPSVAKKMELSSKPGLTDLLMNPNMDMEAFKSNLLDQWYVVPSGDIPPNPSELLASSRMAMLLETLKEHYDYIIIDLPPVNLVSDAVSVSKYISGMVLVVREEYAEKKEVSRCLNQLQFANVKILGCILNATKMGDGSYGKYKHRKYKNYKYYKYFGYDKYDYGGESSEKEESISEGNRND
jgi:capsular exopolysaccharide synthesis family protein